ncbi:MAG TPA: hypothetical protein VN283_01140 [Thiobacillus sp.]|nr:hypothetical protein [Thiobacillus sp.]
MSHPARAPHSGIDGRANAVQGRNSGKGFSRGGDEVGRLNVPQGVLPDRDIGLDDLPLAAVDVGTVRPGRVRNRTKTEPDEKVKKPADGVRKKAPPARKAPARGRYVDEYARPAI